MWQQKCNESPESSRYRTESIETENNDNKTEQNDKQLQQHSSISCSIQNDSALNTD